MTKNDEYRNSLIEEITFGEGRMGETGNVREVIVRIELDLAYCSEKVLNLEMLLMHVSGRASDCEAFGAVKEATSIDFLGKSFEFDNLSGILISEVRELEVFTHSIEKEITVARQKIIEDRNLGIILQDAEEKLKDAETSLKQSFDQISEIKAQSLKSERILGFGHNGSVVEFSEKGKLSFSQCKWPMQTIEQQKQTLQMLEKSLARELDLEKKLSDSRYNEEVVKLKLHYAEHELHCLEEAIEDILERYFEAVNAAEVFMGIAKELTGQLQVVQFDLNGLIRKESELRRNIEENLLKLADQEVTISILKTANVELQSLAQQADILKLRLKEAEDKCRTSNSDALIFKNQVKVLEEQLKESKSVLQQAKASAASSQEKQIMLSAELVDMESAILNLTEEIAKAECRAENAESRCALLAETNSELNQELGTFKNHENTKSLALQEKLKESDAQLEHAKASYEAIEEQHVMLYSAFNDMESVMGELKAKLSKAEKRAENAESRCNLLTETNLELNEEMGAMKDKLEYLEKSLHQADHVRVVTAQDIGIKTKVITDLVVKLALERERLQMQIMSLKKENRFLSKKCLKTNETIEITDKKGEDESVPSVSKAAVTKSSATNMKVESTAAEMLVSSIEEMTSFPPEDESDPPPVRTIEAGQLNCRDVAVAVFFLVLAVLGMLIYPSE